jgi:hypothetical protein
MNPAPQERSHNTDNANMNSHAITSILQILIVALLSGACSAKSLRAITSGNQMENNEVRVGCEQPDFVRAWECDTKCCTGKCQQIWENVSGGIGACEGAPTSDKLISN